MGGKGAAWQRAMLRGDFEAAWRQTDAMEAGRRRGFEPAGPQHLVWDGSPFCGKRVLVRCEHGLGDTIQYSRFLPALGEVAHEVILKVQPMLLDLFWAMPGVKRIINAWTTAPDPPHDVAIECMELAYALRAQPGDVGDCVPYLRPPAPSSELLGALREARQGQQSDRCLKVGFLWASSAWDPRRTAHLEDFAPLAEVPGVQLHSLQQGDARCELNESPFAIHDLSRHTGAIPQAAVAMAAMDLVICVDGMPAHLAGAIGSRVWVLLPYRADWRWMRFVDRSPWYPTMRLFRQRVPGSWKEPVEAVARELQLLAGGRSMAAFHDPA